MLFLDGKPAHWLVLLPSDDGTRNFTDAKAWAASIGGELPTRREQSLLFANLPEQFERDWYWSGEENGSGWAWCQDFYDGTQYGGRQVSKLRARAVRRLPIQ
ncbi:DUF1566 domain-containing protein [Burkholderia cepacia]|nr:DUF1566 domain-containing protein [Burkholderia cepacia]